MRIAELEQYRGGSVFSVNKELLKEGASWVKINGGATAESIKRIQRMAWEADIIISDLDETDTRFPKIKIAKEMFMRTKTKGKLVKFYAKNLVPYLKGEATKNSKELLRNFRPEFRHAVGKHMLIDIDKILLEGVRDSYDALSMANQRIKKYYLSDNEEQSVAPIALDLDFDGIICEKDKTEGAREIIAETGARRVIFKGNSFEDGIIADFFYEEKRCGRIDDILTIAVCTNGPRFKADIYTSANQKMLSRLFEGNL